ncbi:MAG: dethiobiotin synthase [Pseudomonadota bacterium]
MTRSLESLATSVFVAGTDTGIGKTHVAVALLRSLAAVGRRVAAMKPVAAGATLCADGLRNDDALALAAAASITLPYELVNPICLPLAASPHLAARAANRPIDIATLVLAYARIAKQADIVVVEGAGGWLAPISATETMADLARALQLPVLLVVGVRLGCINHSLLTADAIRRGGLELAGWVANPIDLHFATARDSVDAIAERLPGITRYILPGSF